MEKEMERAFPSKGVDPVSGNNVPPGSMPHEVRDDIDAKLSEGEYVIPADVLRYYGVAYFERLRKKAKEDLAEMDKEGRIGGDKGDDLPFSDEELEVEDDAMGMAEGGISTKSEADFLKEQPTFNPTPWSYGGIGAGYGSGSGTGVETKTYINKEGNRVSIMFINGQPISNIPDGYVPDTEEGRKQFQENTGEQVADPNEDNDSAREERMNSDSGKQPISPEENYFAMSEGRLLEVKDPKNLSGLANVPGMIGMAGGLVNTAMQADHLSDLRARATAARERGFETTAQQLEQMADAFAKEAPKAVGMLETMGGLTGENILKQHSTDFRSYTVDQMEALGLSPTSRPAGTRPTYGTSSPPSATPPTPVGSTQRPSTGEALTLRSGNIGTEGWDDWAMPPSSTQSNRDDSDSEQRREERASAGARGVGQETGGRGYTDVEGVETSGQSMTNPGGFDNERGSWGSGPMAKGGLVAKKPVKKTYKKKIKVVDK